MLEFLAAAAGTRIIAAHLGAGPNRFGFLDRGSRLAHHVTPLPSWARRRSLRVRARGRSAKRARRLVHRPLRHIAQKVFKGHQARRAAEDIVANLGFNVHHQFLKNLERLGFVFDQRITLVVGAKADAVPEAIHLIKMFLPKLIDGA